MKEPECVAGCKRFTGGEIKHHKDCPYYPESISKMYDDLESEVKKLRLSNGARRNFKQTKSRN